jgi:hypothetical protein
MTLIGDGFYERQDMRVILAGPHQFGLAKIKPGANGNG